METSEIGTLAVLALVDSTSFGTLLIPVWLLLHPGPLRLGRLTLYLGTVAACYFAVGLALAAGAGALIEQYGQLARSRPVAVAQVAVGVALVALSFLFDSGKAKARSRERAAAGGGGRMVRWRTKVMGEGGSTAAVMGVAFMAVAMELASMLPYLGAIGIISTQGPGWPGNAAVLLAYCAVMIAPALALTLGRIVAARQVTPPLMRLEGWLTKNAASTTAWIVGIVGVIVGLDGFEALREAGAHT